MNGEKELTLREIQEVTLEVALEVDEICKKLDLTYFLAYGTLIGAVRHQGFIPWDDDFDIMMPRNDIKKLKKYLQTTYTGRLKFCCRENTKNYPYGIARVADMDYRYVTTEEGVRQFDIGAFVDIYPLDNFCSDVQTAKKLRKEIKKAEGVYSIYVNPGCVSRKIVLPFKHLIRIFLILIKGKNYHLEIDDKIEKILEKYTSPEDRFVGVPTWERKGIQYKREWFGTAAAHMKFEGHDLSVPVCYDEVLRSVYGDYMKLPPKEKRKPLHDYKLYQRRG